MEFFYVLNEQVLNKQVLGEKIDRTIIDNVKLDVANAGLRSVSITDFIAEINKQSRAGPAKAGTHAADADYVARAINSYDKFESSELIIFGKNDSGPILCACFIYLESLRECKNVTIDMMYGVDSVKAILLNIVKCIGEKIHAKTISIYINKSVSGFYEKNGFVESSVKGGVMVCDRDLDGEDVSMIFNIPPPPRGGKRKTTSQKSKRKNKQRKITKKRNRISSKKRKYYRP